MRRTKYGNCKVQIDGIVFDSQREADRFRTLMLMQMAGVISDLKRQVKYVLIPAQYEVYARYGRNGKRIKDGRRCIERECSYVADFVYIDRYTGRTVVEDTKGVRTKDYLIKRKLMLEKHNIRIQEV